VEFDLSPQRDSLSKDDACARAYNERFALAIHGSADGWWDCDLRVSTTYFSPRWKQMLGYGENEISDQFEEWIKRVHVDDLESFVRVTLQQQMNGEIDWHEFDHRMLHRDGSYRWIHARGSTLRDEHGIVYRMAGWHTDITAHKQEVERQERQAQHAYFRMEVSMALAEHTALSKILQRCTEAMVQHLHAAFARIWTRKQEENVLALQASAGKYTHLNGSHARISLGAFKIGRIAQARRPHLTNDVLNDTEISDQEWARAEGMISFAGYPLVMEDQIVGVMAMFSQQPLMEDTLEALATVANAIAQGIGRKWAEEYLETRVNERTKELQLLLETSHNITSTLELKSLLNTILTQLKTVVDYSAVVLYSLQDEQMKLSNYQGEQALAQITWLLSLVRQQMMQFLQNRPYDYLLIEDISQDGRFSQEFRELTFPAAIGEKPMRSWIGVPLLVRNRLIGFLALFHSRPYYYTRQHASLIYALANQASVALENARLYGQAQELAILQERQRLARELHDSVSQALYGIVLGMRSARVLLHRDPAMLTKLLDHLSEQAETGLTEMRTLIFELRPETLEREGLVMALRKQGEFMQTRYGLRVEMEMGEEPQQSFIAKEALYRITQEALHNIVKHASATFATLHLYENKENASLVLEISDKGAGFNPEQSFPGHLGLQSMRERLERLGGTLHIISSPGQGTQIRAMLP
jgi:PAS domain S-box-containing protein